MKLRYFFSFLSCVVVLSSAAQGVVREPAPPPLALRWSFVKNLYGPIQKSVSLLTVTNKGPRPFPASGWKIYFNSNRAVDTVSMKGSLRIRHIDGDLFCLEPLSDKGIKPESIKTAGTIQSGGNLAVTYTVADLSMNISDAPIGFYLVWDRHPARGYALADYTIGNIEDETLALPTPAMEFARNAGITDLPVSGLPRIFPTPVAYQENKDSGRLTASSPILADPAFKKEAAYLADALTPVLGRRPAVNFGYPLTGKIKQPLAGKNPSGNSLPAAALPEKASHGLPVFLRKKPMDSAAYELSVRHDSIIISAADAEGLFYGIQSLLTAIDPSAWKGEGTMPPGNTRSVQSPRVARDATGRRTSDRIQRVIALPGLEVRDKPRFAYRGFLLDVARNFKSTHELCRVLDLMALYKMNVLHLHFSDDEGWRLEIPSLPELTEIGGRRGHTVSGSIALPASFGSGPAAGLYAGSGYYTQADFIRILRYATARHIRVIPELESPGHARAAIKAMDLRYEKYKKQGNYAAAVQYLLRDTLDRSVYEGAQLWHDNVFCVALPSVYGFIDRVTEDIRQLYATAGAPLSTIHLGGDEVPAGVWEGSPACRKLTGTYAVADDPAAGGKTRLAPMDTASAARLRAECWAYYYHRLDSLLKSKGLMVSGWEEVAVTGNKDIQMFVWDNMIGGGNEDLPYRLANAGYPVILACVSNNYYDLAYRPAFEEKGYHWGGFQDVDKAFSFIPYDYYKNSGTDYMGNPVRPGYFSVKEKLTEAGRPHIAGIEGLLWGENLPTDERMEYMLLPKLLGTAERAWAADPDWATTTDTMQAAALYAAAFNVFVNTLGKRELPRLSFLDGGYAYRIPTAGFIRSAGQLVMNCPFPGLTIRYTTDGSEPDARSHTYTGPIADQGITRIKIFDASGRGGRTVSTEK